MSLIDELIFTLAISMIVTTIIIRLLALATDAAAAPNKPAENVSAQSSSSAFRRGEPGKKASAVGESHSAGSVIDKSASPAVSTVETHFVTARIITKLADYGGESSKIVINEAKQAPIAGESHAVPAKSVAEQAAELASPVEKYDPGVVYRVDYPDSARDWSREGTVIGKQATELGKSAARESETLNYFGLVEVESSRDAAIGSSSEEEEDKTAVVIEAAASPCRLAVGVISQQQILLRSPDSVDHKADAKVFDESSKRDNINIEETGSNSDDLVDEKTELRETEIQSTEDVGTTAELRVLEREEDAAGVMNETLGNNVNEEEELIDDWEGIERTELEKNFGAAVAFVGSRKNAGCISRLTNDTKMKLYGLHKVAIQGTCLLPQPMALKVTARANWNAWQVLGDMTRETAMEQYIAILSSSLPAWIEDGAKDDYEVLLDRKMSPSTDSLEALDIDNQSLPEELNPPDKGHGLMNAV